MILEICVDMEGKAINLLEEASEEGMNDFTVLDSKIVNNACAWRM